MIDGIEISGKGFRQRLGTYLIMMLLVAFTVAGYLTVNAYWVDASRIAKGSVEPLGFPYLKATVLFAYWDNPPSAVGEEPAPRHYTPLFNDGELARIREVSHVTSISIGYSQEGFTKYGHQELLFLEPGSPVLDSLRLVEGRWPVSMYEIAVPLTLSRAGATPGSVLNIIKPDVTVPIDYPMDRMLKYPEDPASVADYTVTGVYEPSSAMISGPVGYLPINRVGSYPELNPKEVTMSWPAPNTMFLGLDDPAKAHDVILYWYALYPDLPETEVHVLPPPKVFWTPDLPEVAISEAAGQVATPLFNNTMHAFLLSAIGIFTAMFTSFLDRRKELGIMKTVGMDDAHTALTVSLEVAFTATLGTVLGIAAATVVTGSYLKGVSGNALAVPGGSILTSAFVALLLLLAATYVPRAMARQGTVLELLYGRSIPIVRKRHSER